MQARSGATHFERSAKPTGIGNRPEGVDNVQRKTIKMDICSNLVAFGLLRIQCRPHRTPVETAGVL